MFFEKYRGQEPDVAPYTMTVFFRIHWLPIGFEKGRIKEFLEEAAEYIEVIDIEHEKWATSDILNGVIKVNAKIEVYSFHDFLDFTGQQTIENFRALIQPSGLPVKCKYCKEFGHMRSQCVKVVKKSTQSKKNGHLESECNMALATVESPQIDENLNEEVLGEGMELIETSND